MRPVLYADAKSGLAPARRLGAVGAASTAGAAGHARQARDRRHHERPDGDGDPPGARRGDLQGKALRVAESANLLMMPGRARDEDRWMQDAKLMLDAGRAAYRAARAKDLAALDAPRAQPLAP